MHMHTHMKRLSVSFGRLKYFIRINKMCDARSHCTHHIYQKYNSLFDQEKDTSKEEQHKLFKIIKCNEKSLYNE